MISVNLRQPKELTLALLFTIPSYLKIKYYKRKKKNIIYCIFVACKYNKVDCPKFKVPLVTWYL